MSRDGVCCYVGTFVSLLVPCKALFRVPFLPCMIVLGFISWDFHIDSRGDSTGSSCISLGGTLRYALSPLIKLELDSRLGILFLADSYFFDI